MHNRHSFRSLISILLIFMLVSCAQLPTRESIQPSYAIDKNTPSKLASLTPNIQSELSGFYPLADGVEAFIARLALIEAAEHSIDAQYYLFHRQQTGIIFTAYLLAAAERGVRVRLLLDDMSQAETELDLAALAVHPNFEIRFFNPFPNRSVRAAGFVTDYSHLSRRMHNKSFIVDNRAFITGGRNIGNAYFAAEDHSEFIDLDVLAVGNIVPEASLAFDVYWNHQLSYPIELLNGERDQHALQDVQWRLKNYLAQPESDTYLSELKKSDFVARIAANELVFDWQQSQLFYDSPDKLVNEVGVGDETMSSQLLTAMASPERKAIIVSPYFIPKERGVELLSSWVEQGVDVTVLTNSLAATDVAAVHAGYQNYRVDLLKAGVKLWELKPSDLVALKQQAGKKVFGRISGSSQASLHAKTMTFDDSRIFIGSMNLDPRSFALNTEMGLLIESEKLSTMLAKWVDNEMAVYAWQLTLENPDDTQILWIDTLSNEQFDSEPLTSSWQRFKVWFISLFPVEDQL